MSKEIPSSKPRRGRGPANSHQITPSRNPGSADPARPDCRESASEGTGTPDETRLRLLFVMKLRGLTQVEIARRFDVTERTIRNWEKQLPNLELPVLENMDPNQEVAHTLCRYAANEIDLIETKNAARAEGDHKTVIAASRELRNLEKDRTQFLGQLGILGRVKLPENMTDDSSAMSADPLIGIVSQLFAGSLPSFETDEPTEDH